MAQGRTVRPPTLSSSRFTTGGIAWSFLREVAALLHNGDEVDCLDLSAAVHLKPYVVAVCVAVCRRCPAPGFHVIWPNDPQAMDHLARLDVPGVLDQPAVEIESRATNIPLAVLTAAPSGEFSWEVVSKLEGFLSRPLAPGCKQRLAEHIDEVVRNALGHSESPIGCVVCGQVFPGTDILEAVIVDLGMTIGGHLRRKYPDAGDDAAAIILATEEGITGTPTGGTNQLGEPNSGVGLYELRTYMQGGHGELSILSGARVVTFGEKEPMPGELFGPPFGGTLVNLKFKL